MENADKPSLLELTAEITSAFLSHNAVRTADVPALIETLHKALGGLASAPPEAVAEPLVPAVPIKKSVTDDFIISLEDGRKFKTMKRYLSLLGMTPDQYRTKWGLPNDYPMVARSYAKARSEMAQKIGLGRKSAAAAKPAPAEPAPAKKRGRAKAA